MKLTTIKLINLFLIIIQFSTLFYTKVHAEETTQTDELLTLEEEELSYEKYMDQYKNQIKFFNDTNTYILDENNFNNITLSGFGSKKWLIVFYAPWCKHCKTLLPIIHEVSKNLTQQKSLGIKVGVVNSEENSYLSERFLVNGFPTTIYLANGNLFEYEGERTEEAIIDFVIDGWTNQRGARVPMDIGFFRSQFKNFGKIFVIICVIGIAIIGGLLIYECLGKSENIDGKIEEEEQEQEELLKKKQ